MEFLILLLALPVYGELIKTDLSPDNYGSIQFWDSGTNIDVDVTKDVKAVSIYGDVRDDKVHNLSV